MIKLFTHNDLDGVGCAILARMAFGEYDVDIEYCDYGQIDSRVEDYFNSGLDYECHITDISISNELANKINDSKKKYQLLDHHATALNLNKFLWCKVQVEDEFTGFKTSGTEMYYRWLIENNYLQNKRKGTASALYDFVELVRDYDTWRWATLGEDGIICKQVNDLLYLYGRNRFIDWCEFRFAFGDFPKLQYTDRLVLEIKQREIDDYVKAKDKQLIVNNLCGRTCGFVFAEKYFSELGNRLCQMHPEIDFIAMIDMKGSVSYRTVKDDIDLGKDIAQVFGGGGHQKAAGSRFSKEVQMKIIKEIFE